MLRRQKTKSKKAPFIVQTGWGERVNKDMATIP